MVSGIYSLEVFNHNIIVSEKDSGIFKILTKPTAWVLVVRWNAFL